MEERFLSKVDTSGDCWIWQAGLYDKRRGYGGFNVNGKMERAHRVAYRLFVGEIPGNLCVCHKCDNPKCVNPQHLFLGTQLDNIKDRESKKRTAHGPDVHNKNTKLTVDLAQQIKMLKGSDT